MRGKRTVVSELAEKDFGFSYDSEFFGGNYESKDVVKKISKLMERPEIYPVYSDKCSLPKVGECVLINEREESLFSRIHGGRYRNERSRRYFGKVVEIHPHVIVMETDKGMKVSERIDDFKVGLVKFVRLKQLPEKAENISYDERLLDTFIESFENLL